jgi:hypothetical protein
LHFGSWGVMEILWGKLMIFYWKIARYWKKMYNHFIFTNLLNPCESSYYKCHRLSFWMFQTQLICSIGHFGVKTIDFWQKSVKLLQGSKY